MHLPEPGHILREECERDDEVCDAARRGVKQRGEVAQAAQREGARGLGADFEDQEQRPREEEVPAILGRWC